MKRRLIYALVALALLGLEVCIALFVHDSLVRPYLGDVLVVILIHCALRVIFPHRPRLLPLYVFLFACLTELAQLVRLLDWLELGHVQLLRIVVGGTFDWMDIVCYGVGCAVVAVAEHIARLPGARAAWKAAPTDKP